MAAMPSSTHPPPWGGPALGASMLQPATGAPPHPAGWWLPASRSDPSTMHPASPRQLRNTSSSVRPTSRTTSHQSAPLPSHHHLHLNVNLVRSWTWVLASARFISQQHQCLWFLTRELPSLRRPVLRPPPSSFSLVILRLGFERAKRTQIHLSSSFWTAGLSSHSISIISQGHWTCVARTDAPGGDLHLASQVWWTW